MRNHSLKLQTTPERSLITSIQKYKAEKTKVNKYYTNTYVYKTWFKISGFIKAN